MLRRAPPRTRVTHPADVDAHKRGVLQFWYQSRLQTVSRHIRAGRLHAHKQHALGSLRLEGGCARAGFQLGAAVCVLGQLLTGTAGREGPPVIRALQVAVLRDATLGERRKAMRAAVSKRLPRLAVIPPAQTGRESVRQLQKRCVHAGRTAPGSRQEACTRWGGRRSCLERNLLATRFGAMESGSRQSEAPCRSPAPAPRW